MSEHELTDEQREIRALARRFAAGRRSPRTPPRGTASTAFPQEVFARLGELGLMGACVPVEHGGAGADFLSYVLALEELARADAGVAVTVAVHTSAARSCCATLAARARHAEQVDAARAAARAGARAGRVRADRAGGRLRRRPRCAPAPTPTGRITGAKQFITTG